MSKGGGKGQTPREAKDKLESKQKLSGIVALSEGPLLGHVKGPQNGLNHDKPWLGRTDTRN
ncbi:hypothetical protein, partial [Salmonella enterica]|uniref:hypothetical protein n=1 Tax=Salmonella enterica TaxID=28901 RepID=UPI00398C3A58